MRGVHNAAFASQSRPLQDWNGQAGAAPNAVGNLASSTKSNELDRTQASILAQAIRDGQFETPPVFDPHHQLRRGTMPSTGAPYPMNTLQMLPFGQANSSTGGSDPLLEHLTRNGRPTVEEAFQHIAFVDRCKNARPMTWGVVKISNIPYGTTKPEIVAHVGRNARLVTQGPPGCPWYGIHIIMERSTAKTMDCFVEFESGEEATQSIQRFHRQCMSGRHPRIGDRHVDLEASSQEALMKELFPRAKCVRWNGQDPEPYQTDEPYNSGFKGFVTSEEMVMTVKHAETPQRYPWWAANYYTLSERDLLFKAANSLICALREQLRKGTNNNQLTPQLLQELVYAALHAPAFSERQRYQLFISAGGPGHVPINMSPLAPYWVFEGLGRREDATEQVVQYYASLLHTATTSSAFLSLAEQSANSAAGTTRSPFGNVVVPYARADKGTYSMARVIQLEWDVIEGLLRKILSPEAAAGGF
ncbi:hypothetical protein LTR04_005887 [Oleoguttula sp. CCFEE 6159]|nr:hypothetical protein LTR04_005887 [Oleoguttula sp. CCFEE 6159]